MTNFKTGDKVRFKQDQSIGVEASSLYEVVSIEANALGTEVINIKSLDTGQVITVTTNIIEVVQSVSTIVSLVKKVISFIKSIWPWK